MTYRLSSDQSSNICLCLLQVRLADVGISRTNEMHSLRLTGGPILPSVVMRLRRVIQKLQDSAYEDKIHGLDLRMSRHAFTHAMGPEAALAEDTATN